MRKNWPCFIILGLYLVCILAANSKGEFPLNDDWSYARSAFFFATGQGMHVDAWSAPSLVGQALYGGMLARIFSPRFEVLRYSTLFLSCCTAVLLWGIFSKMKVRKSFASVLLLAWIFNPLQFNLSFSFMTEIPFLFFITLAIFLYVLFLDIRKSYVLGFAAAALGYAYLIRQTAVFFVIALICSLLIDSQTALLKRVRQSVLTVIVTGLFIGGYYVWVASSGGSVPAVHRKYELLLRLSSKQLIGNSYGIFFYSAFMILPALLFLFSSQHRMSWNVTKKIGGGVLAGWSIIAVVGLCWFHAHADPRNLLSATFHARMPFLLNVLYDSGLGPITLDPTYFGPSPTPLHTNAWAIVTIAVSIAATGMGSICVFGLLQLRKAQALRRPLLIFSGMAFIGVVLFEIIFSHLEEGGLFDRHILTAVLPFCLLLILFSGALERKENRISLSGISVSGVALLAYMAFSVAATHDYMEWNRIRWDMGRSLIAAGVDPLNIVGGFEFNAWHNYDAFSNRGDSSKVPPWWYDRRDYVIAMTPEDGRRIMKKQEYFSWVHQRPVTMYLSRDSADGQN
jgi:hypothetical protein